MAMAENLAALLEQRFGASVDVPPELARLDELVHAAAHRSDRAFTDDPVPSTWTETLLACALSAPAKSDLQQVSIVHVEDTAKRAAVAALVPTLDWLPSAPLLLIFCGDSRRIRRICALRERPFANDHLDAMFNASVDAALVMMNFIRVARAAGLGCCPISMVRDQATALADLLELPDGVFPVAGMAAGFPAAPVAISPRLPLSLTVHTDRYDDSHLEAAVDAYDERRRAVQPIADEQQRDTQRFGAQEKYGWSEDKARQVSRPQRADFGRYLREHGFRLD
ncbi:MAG: NADPH-dependent oxidoreductase [Gammaproteobacteria bacterium]|jgi:nitroreductase/FMN reductase [NAD(P)H]|nr:NADPH-dependent oxidoreductase [Gammaproteobacteria bacterium]